MMKVSVSANLRRRPNANGHFTVVLRITCNGKTTDRSTGIAVEKKNWDEKKAKIKSGYHSGKKNEILMKKILEVQEKVLKLQSKLNLSLSDITASLDENHLPSGTYDMPFSEYVDTYIRLNPDALGKNTLKYYRTTITRWTELHSQLSCSSVRAHHIISFREMLIKKYNTGVIQHIML